MYSCEEILKPLSDRFPLNTCEEWDNSGLLINSHKSVSNIMVCLDISNDVVKEAVEKHCQMIISHHPIIFNPIKSISANSPVYSLIKNDISAICMHTCLDKGDGGVNDILAKKLSLTEIESLPTYGRIGTLNPALPFAQLALLVAKVLDTTVSTVACHDTISKVAVIGGSGAEFLDMAKMRGANCLITGDADYHDAQKARELNISLIVAGHYATENPVCEVLCQILEQSFPKAKIMLSEKAKDFFD